MSKLSALQGKGKVFNIGGIELEIKPLRLNELDNFTVDEKASSEKQIEVAKRLIRKVLKDAVPEATDDELDNVGMQHMEELMAAIVEVNGLDKKKSDVSKIRDVIQARQNQTTS